MARRLVIFVPAITGRTAAWNTLRRRLTELDGYGEPDCDWIVVPHGGRGFRTGSVTKLAATAGARIHEQWVAAGGYDEVVLVGHSLGGLVLRQAYLAALGVNGAHERRPWAGNVDRIVLFASLNRGVDVSWHRAWWLPPLAWCARVLPVLKRWLVHDLLRGPDFITNLRITWIREINAQDHPPLVVQYLGTKDRLVTSDDSSDIHLFPTGRQEFLAEADHSNLLRLDIAENPDARFRLIANAFTTPRDAAVVPEIGAPEKRVVILLHGIRAGNTTWVNDLKELLKGDALSTAFGEDLIRQSNTWRSWFGSMTRPVSAVRHLAHDRVNPEGGSCPGDWLEPLMPTSPAWRTSGRQKNAHDNAHRKRPDRTGSRTRRRCSHGSRRPRGHLVLHQHRRAGTRQWRGLGQRPGVCGALGVTGDAEHCVSGLEADGMPNVIAVLACREAAK